LFVLSPGWPQTHDPPALISRVLGLQACVTMPGLNIFLISVCWNQTYPSCLLNAISILYLPGFSSTW
jgi:hypothetical protein